MQMNAFARGTDDCQAGIDAFLNKEYISWRKAAERKTARRRKSPSNGVSTPQATDTGVSTGEHPLGLGKSRSNA